MLLQGFRKAVAALDARANVADHIPHDFIGGLVGQRLQRLHDGQPGINHGRKLPREYHQVGQGNTSPARVPLLADLLLDGEDEHITVQQGGNRDLLSGGLDGTADLPVGPRLSRYIYK